MGKASVYIDGFNLYYGSLKGTPHKWLDVRALAERVLPLETVTSVKYCTAKIKPRLHDPTAPIRQTIYWRALRTLPGLEIIEGSFLTKPKKIALANQRNSFRLKLCRLLCSDITLKDGVWLARVQRTEEKGSDVNIAAHLINDAHFNRFDHGLVVSGDSDLVKAVEIVAKEIGKPITVLNPQQRTSRELLKVATTYRHIHSTDLAACQLSATIADAKGQFGKPNGW